MKSTKRNSIQTFSNGQILKLSFTISIIIYIVMLIGACYAKVIDIGTGRLIGQIISLKTLYEFIINTLTIFILFKFQFWAIKRNKKHKKKTPLPILLGSFVLMLVLSIFFAFLSWVLFRDLPLNILLTIHFMRDLIVLVITLLITIILLMWERTQREIVEKQKLLTENLQNRYEALKNQVDPHFLFNSLNTLNGLIGYDDDKAHDYLDQLSSVFRYTIQNKNIIHLEDELSFLESYIYLMKIRYNESLQIEFNIEMKYLKYCILPFGSQLLIENCIKHNVISNKYPLLITVETTENDTLRVRNTIHLKPDAVSFGVGLANLNERYQLMFNKEIKITNDETFFTVEVPLINDIEKYKNKFNNN
jgi:sensor histidine kinase YesM